MTNATSVVYNNATDKWEAHFNGSVIHRAKTREIAEATIQRMEKMLEGDTVAPQVKPQKVEVPTIKNVLVKNERSPFVPGKNPNYIAFGNYRDVDKIVKSGIFYPTYIFGPSGNGKSEMIEQLCHSHKRAMIRVNFTQMTDEETLIGSKTLKDGNVEIVEGPVLIAMRTGSILLLDEIDAGSPNSVLCLQSILEGKPYYFKLTNELVTPAPGFNVFATANTKGRGSEDGKYNGTNIQNEAFLERFAVTIEQEYPSQTVELKIINKLMQAYSIVDEQFAVVLAKWSDSIRRTYDDGGCDELITTRRIGHIIRAYAVFGDKKKAITLCCNRFDKSTKDAFVELYNKISPEALPDVEVENNEEVLQNE